MIRPKGYCGCCGETVEYYSDGLDGVRAAFRCGNCFQPYTGKQIAALHELQSKLDEADAARRKLVERAMLNGGE